MLKDRDTVERAWVELREITRQGYHGLVVSKPAVIPVKPGDSLTFRPCHVLRIHKPVATSATPAYEEMLADAEVLDTDKHWAPVLVIEQAAATAEIRASMRGEAGAATLAAFLARNPVCVSCESRGLKGEATHAVYIGGESGGDGDDNLAGLCSICIHVRVARQRGWPIRGCDISGMPNDPAHPWNLET